MITKLFVLSVLLAAPLLALATGDNADYYSARPDLRKCASPLCGGIFVPENPSNTESGGAL